jgi:hypothetical protein
VFTKAKRCMPKTKRTIIPFIIFASLIVAVLFYVTVRKRISPAEPLKAVPVNAMLVVKVNSFTRLYEKTALNSQIWRELKQIPGFDRIDMQFRFLDSLLRTVPEVEKILSNPPSFISAHTVGKDRISILHTLQLPQGYGEISVNTLITKLVGDKGTISTRPYEGVTVHEISLNGNGKKDEFLWAVSRNILMISFSPIVLEDAIRQLGSDESIASLKGFQEIYATAGKNVDANVFINFDRFPLGLATLVTSDMKSLARSSSHFARWAGMDLNMLSDMLLMNGFIQPPDSATSLAGLFVNQDPRKITVDKILPASTAAFLSLAMSDPSRYFNDYRNYLQELGKLGTYNRTLSTFNETYQCNFPGDFADLMDNEITLAFDSPESQPDSSKIFVLVKVKSQGQAAEKMMNLVQHAAASESRQVMDYTFEYKLDNEVSFSIYRLPVYNLTSNLFGELFAGLGDHYFVFIDNYLVFGSSPSSLRSLIHDQVLNKTLENDDAYRSFKNSLSPRSNILFYNNMSKSRSIFGTYLRKSLAAAWHDYEPLFLKIPVTGFQVYSDNKLLYSNLIIRYLPGYNRDTQTVWESRLDTLAACKPVFVVNHQTGQNEVFVQDMKRNIYLINQVGRILWKVQLPELINSEIFQVDYFRNGKLQFLFSTGNYLYLVDRLGNFVEHYPVKLRAPATSGVSVFDYDNTREYRLFIACSDNKVYAYTKEGALLNGWIPFQTESEVLQPVNHFRIGNKDFLVFGDRFRTYVLDRKGNSRMSEDIFFPKSVNNGYYPWLPGDGSSPGIVTTDTTGKVYRILFNGKIETVDMGTYSGRHFFDLRDLNNDGKMEYIFTDGKKLNVFDSEKNRLFVTGFNEAVSTRPSIYQFSSNDTKLGIVCKEENQIYLFNNDGKLFNGFPLSGNTAFSIGNFGDTLSHFNLVVGSRDNFLYNYRVQ